MIARVCLLLPLLVTGCSLASAPDITTDRHLVGKAGGTDIVVGAAVNDGRVAFYACGGLDDVAKLTHWFKGTVDANGNLSVPDDEGWKLEGYIDDQGGHGRVTPPADDGAPFDWSLRASTESKIEGLYTVVIGGCRTGVVVTHPNADDAPGIQGATCVFGAEDIFEQVLPITPIELVGGGLTVQAPVKGVLKPIFVSRVLP